MFWFLSYILEYRVLIGRIIHVIWLCLAYIDDPCRNILVRRPPRPWSPKRMVAVYYWKTLEWTNQSQFLNMLHKLTVHIWDCYFCHLFLSWLTVVPARFFLTFLGQTMSWPINHTFKFWMIPGEWLLGGGNSNVFYFHPENWGRFPCWLIFLKGVETTN